MNLFLRRLLALIFVVAAGLSFFCTAQAQDEKKPEVKKSEAPLDPVAKEAARIKSWEKQMATFADDDAKKPFPTGETVFVGSSSIRMWKLPDSFGERKVLNRGFGGSQIVDSVTYLDTLVIKHKPKTVVLYAGDNDLASGKSVEKVVDDFKAFVSKLQAALPETKIIYIGIKPSISRWKMVDKVRAANREIQSFAGSSKNVVFIDIDKPMLGASGEPNPELFLKDGLHMTPAGYKVWTSLLMPHLEK